MVRPLEKSASRYQHILVVADYTTFCLATVPLCMTKVTVIAPELMKLFSHIGFPDLCDILTDQGINFTLQVIQVLHSLLRIKSLRKLPQTDGLIERFNKTLKEMLKCFVRCDPSTGSHCFHHSYSP